MEAHILTVLCPSRGRPQAAYELLASFRQTKTGDSRLVFCLDHDDPTLRDYPEPQVIGAPTGDPTGPLNAAALADTSQIIAFTGDDSRFATKGWDRAITQTLSGRGGLAWGDDSHDIPWPSTVFVSRLVIQTLGWFALPTLKRGYFDVVWRDLAYGTQSAYELPHLKIPHDNSKGVVSPEVIESDRLAYEAWKSGQAVQDIRRLGIALDRDFFFA